MTPVEGFAAVVVLGAYLATACPPAGPEDPPEWDYDCGEPTNIPASKDE